MKNTFWLLIIQSILCLSACTGGQTEYWLEQAENYLDKKPDSTLIFLEKIKNPDQLADYPKAICFRLLLDSAKVRPYGQTPCSQKLLIFSLPTMIQPKPLMLVSGVGLSICKRRTICGLTPSLPWVFRLQQIL